MNVRFIDTSILVNLLDVPNMNQDAERVKQELKEAVVSGDTLILPLATIVETGNHIAHVKGDRFTLGEKFAQCLVKTANDEAPWKFNGQQWSKEDLLYMAKQVPDFAAMGIGVGDISIIKEYENFKERTPGIGHIMIWSMDDHLQAYEEDMTTVSRRKNR